MIYDHRVKRNGVYDAAGEEVPDVSAVPEKSINNEPDETLGAEEDTPSAESARRGRPKKSN